MTMRCNQILELFVLCRSDRYVRTFNLSSNYRNQDVILSNPMENQY